MQPDQGLAGFASRALVAVSEMLGEVRPDVVLVQGDTTTLMMAALAAFYWRIPVGHVEAGLRTRNRYNPFPEEINRRMAGVLATCHFAPTERAASALRAEQMPEEGISSPATNTVVDALLMTVQRPVELELDLGLNGRRLILVTACLVGTDRHRIVAEAECLLHDKGAYRTMAQAGSPFRRWSFSGADRKYPFVQAMTPVKSSIISYYSGYSRLTEY